MAKRNPNHACPYCGTADAVPYTPHGGPLTYACRNPKCGRLFHATPDAPPDAPPDKPKPGRKAEQGQTAPETED